MGITFPVFADQRMDLSVYFPGPDETLRSFPTAALPELETAYAMTVHKSQGSEFEDIVLILPDIDTRILTKELLYTGITRTRQHITLWASEASIRRTIERKIDRSSGFRDRLNP